MEYDVGKITTPSVTLCSEDVGIDVAQYQPTSRPIEDRFSVNHDVAQSRLVIGVYDGHGGSETAQHVSDLLPTRLLQHPRNSDAHIQQFEQLDEAILRQFRQDHTFFRRKSKRWVYNAQLVKSGSTALILDIDLGTLSASYANLGDCRLVVLDPTGESANALLLQTEDINMHTPSEQKRLIGEHPNEGQMIVGGRLFGRLMATRGFGDGYYKLPKGIFGQHRKYINTLSSIERPGKIPMNWQYAPLFYAYKTPPYIISRPETGNLQLEKGNIVILATDGFWDLVSSDEATQIVLRSLTTDGVEDLAQHLLHEVNALRAPGDDVTLIVLRV